MGTINVKGIGVIEIEGDEPTPEEAAAIAAGPVKSEIDFEEEFESEPIEPVGEGRTGLIPTEARSAVRETVEELPGLFQFLAEMAPSTAGVVAGAAAGTAVLPGPGTLVGAIGGGLLGEFIGQETGVAPESDVNLALSAGGPVGGKIVGGILRLGRRATGALISKLPPAKAALAKITSRKAVDEFESVGGNILAKQKGLMARPASDLYAAAKKAGAMISPREFSKAATSLQNLMSELKIFGAFPEGQQAMQLVRQAFQTLAPKERGVSFDALVAARTMIGAAVSRAELAGGIRLGSAKQVFKELAETIDRIAAGSTPARRGAQILKTAAARAKLEFSVRDFERAVARFTKIDAGEDIVTINISRLQNWLRNVTNPKAKAFDKNFTDALKDHLPDINKRLLGLGKITGTGSAAGPGSIVVRGIGAKTGRSLVSAVIGFGVAGGPGAAIGGLAGAAMPEMITAILMSPKAFTALTKAMALGKAPISAEAWLAVGQIIARGSTFRPSDRAPAEIKEDEGLTEFGRLPEQLGEDISPIVPSGETTQDVVQ